MKEKKINLVTEVVCSDDGSHTYEIKKTWDKQKRKGLVIELYPTSSDAMNMDLSTMHLMNHANELGFGTVRIVNLYSTIYNSKPLAKSLETEATNIKYILNILDSPDISEYNIVIAWGSSLSSNKKTIEKKLMLLSAMKEKKLFKQVKHIEAEEMDEDVPVGVHPLFLGLHYPKNKWSLKSFPMTETLSELSRQLKKNNTKKKINKREERNNVSKNNE